MRPSSSIMVVTSCRCGTLRHGHRPVRQQAPGQNRQRGVLGARNADLALERDAAVDLQLIHECRPARLARAVFLRREHLRARARGSRCPSAPRGSRRPADGAARRAVPANFAAITTASKCTLSSLATDARLPGKPRWMSSATCCGFMPCSSSCIIRRWTLTTRTKSSSISGCQALTVEIDGLRAQLPRLGRRVCTRLPDLS